MIYYSSKELFAVQAFKTIRSFGKNIYSGKITMNEADQKQADLVEYVLNFNNKTIPKNRDDKKKLEKTFLMLQKILMKVENQLSMRLRADYFC